MLEDTVIIDSESKIPLYLQLKEQIKNYISSGQAREDEQLPPVNALASKLGIHFETVRKAYKDLENDGLIVMKRGLGTFFNPSSVTNSPNKLNSGNGDFVSEAKELIMKSLKRGEYVGKILEDFQKALDEVSKEFHGQKVVFTECTSYQTETFSKYLIQFLNCSFTPNHYIDVEGVLVSDLKDFLKNPDVFNGKFSIVTTGFHFDEVKKIVGGLPINIHVLITNMSRETRRRLASFDNDTKYAFISHNQHIASLIMDILKEELGDVSIEYCSSEDEKRIKHLIKTVDAVLAPPSVYKEIKELIPPEVPVIEVFDIIDLMSLKLLKDQLFSEYKTSPN
jgi:DNA-binding transcriptional regulator YhcF (GntR family)